MKRREFMKTSSALAGAALLGACSKPESFAGVQWKYAMCNESMQDLPWAKQCEIISKAGYTGVEIASFTLVKESVAELSADKRKEMVMIMQDNGIECCGLHWLLTPPPHGLHFTTPEPIVRSKTVDYLSQLIDFCGDLGGKVMIFGSPNQRSTINGATQEDAKKYFAEGLANVTDKLVERDVKILIEHLGHNQTDVVNTLKEAIQVADAVNHPNVDIMFDFHNTIDEDDDFVTLLDRYYSRIHHVHVMEMDGKHLGTGTAVNDYVQAFQFLKNKKYDKWVSLEVFDFEPGGEKIANESMQVLKEIERKLS